MLGGATHHGNLHGDNNLHDSETMSGFRRGVVRATILHGAIRASDFLTGVSASSTAAAVRDAFAFAESDLASSNRRCRERGDDVGMEATRRIGFCFDADVASPSCRIACLTFGRGVPVWPHQA